MSRTMKMLYGPAAVPGSATTLYTSPANTRTTVQYIHVTNSAAGTAGSFVLSKGAIGAANVFYVARSGTNRIPEAGGLFERWVQFVLEPGELLQCVGDTQLSLTISGFTEMA